MAGEGAGGVRYAIADPTGNITALVYDPVEVARQPEVARQVMERHPEVEQVGFVPDATDGAQAPAALRMAGGEFCGNATMSAAVLHVVQAGQAPSTEDELVVVQMRVSGASRPVEVRIVASSDGAFEADVRMPEARDVIAQTFAFAGVVGQLPLVLMEGISHVVVPESSPFHALLADRASAEAAVRQWCHDLGADGLGLMFLEGDASSYRLTPLVYVPGSNTVFWENSCASGSAAVGRFLARETGASVGLALHEPGGTLRVASDAEGRQTWLHGSVRLVGEHLL